MWRVLCIDDDAKIAEQVAEYFTSWSKDNPFDDLEVLTETDFDAGSKRLANERFDLITLDLHGEKDPTPASRGEDDPAQQGRRVLDKLRKTRFVPVIFYSGYADKIANLQSPVVRVVKKGEDDLAKVREAARAIFATGLPKLIRHIDEEQRSYLWDTVDKHWSKFFSNGGKDEIPYLLARRLAARLNHESITNLLNHERDHVHPVEFYIYPPLAEKIKTGGIYSSDKNNVYWIVATPACDFARDKADRVLLVGATELSCHKRFIEWNKSKWTPGQEDESGKKKSSYGKFCELLNNNAGERYYFLPGTFFIPDLIADMQLLRQVTTGDLDAMNQVCRLDSSYREEFLLRVSKYYGRIGTPDLEISAIFSRLCAE